MAYIGNTVQNQGFAPAVDYFNGDGVTVTLHPHLDSALGQYVYILNTVSDPFGLVSKVGQTLNVNVTL